MGVVSAGFAGLILKIVLSDRLDEIMLLHRIGLAWANIAGGLGSGLIWLAPVSSARLSGLWLTIAILFGSIATHLDQSNRSKLTVCSVKPQIRPLQVSCLAAEALVEPLLRLLQ